MTLEVVYERPPLYRRQRVALFDGLDCNEKPARIACVEASTKAGKTVGAMAWFFEQAAIGGLPNRNYWWIAPTYAQAKIAFRRLKHGLPRNLYRANDSDLTITLVNGAVMWFKSGEKPDNLYGEDVYAAVIDEASRVRAESWVAVRSTLTATRGPIRLIGNVKGRTNWFFRICRQAEAGSPGLSYAKITAFDAAAAGVLDPEEIEGARRDLPDRVFRELYLAEPSDDEGNPFGMQHIAACVAPMTAERPAAIGVDLAKSIDWTVMIGLDRSGATCGFDRWQQIPWDETEARILANAGQVPLLIDSTGVGDPIVERMQRKRTGIEGFKFSASSKQRLMEGLAVAIQSRAVTFPEGPIRLELEMFEYAYTRTGVRYTAPEGVHDDCVMALALAVEKHRAVVPRIASVGPAGNAMISPWLGATSG